MEQSRSASEFKVGDKAVYPAQGVAEVVSIEEREIAGARQRFYVLRILDSDRRIMVPVKNAETVGLRCVICEEEIREIFEILRERIARRRPRLGRASHGSRDLLFAEPVPFGELLAANGTKPGVQVG